VPKYRVSLERKMFQTASVEIEAESQEEAELLFDNTNPGVKEEDWEDTQPDDGPVFVLDISEVEDS
jgi:hypothetical protein